MPGADASEQEPNMSDAERDTPRVLFVVTSSDRMGASGDATGVWLGELAVPYLHLRDAGLEVEICSVAGGRLPVDPRSVEERGHNPAPVERFLETADADRAMNDSQPLSAVDWQDFDAVFFPGGHGTMWDFPESAEIARLVSDFLARRKIVAAVCHGPAALVAARDASGEPVIAGRQLSAFTDSEERAVGLFEAVPFSLETRLRELGAEVRTGPDFQPMALRDGCLITGQNPPSSQRVAELLVEALNEAR
jgi:putative intracellular protease/amidase